MLELWFSITETGLTVGHDDVDLAKPHDRRVDQLVDVGQPGHVGLHGQRAIGPDLGDHLVGCLAVRVVVDDDGRAVGSQALGRRAADAFGGAGDEDDLAGERHDLILTVGYSLGRGGISRIGACA